MGKTYSMCCTKQEYDPNISEVEADSFRSTQPCTPDIVTSMNKSRLKRPYEGWCLSARSTNPESLVDAQETEEEHIRDAYAFGKILSTSENCIVREGYDRHYPSQKVVISVIEWKKVEKYHQTILDHIKALKEAEHPNIANLIRVFVEHDTLMKSTFPAEFKDGVKHPSLTVPIEYIYIVTEYAEGVDLHEYIEKFGPITEECAVVIVHQILNVLKHFKSLDFSADEDFMNNILGLPRLHSIINPRNIRIDPETLEVTIMNIGLGNTNQENGQNSDGEQSPPDSPDLEARDDLWNLGYILSKMCKSDTEKITDFIFKCKTKDCSEKFSLKQALAHGFLRFRNSAKFAIRLEHNGLSRISSISNSISSTGSSFLSF